MKKTNFKLAVIILLALCNLSEASWLLSPPSSAPEFSTTAEPAPGEIVDSEWKKLIAFCSQRNNCKHICLISLDTYHKAKTIYISSTDDFRTAELVNKIRQEVMKLLPQPVQISFTFKFDTPIYPNLIPLNKLRVIHKHVFQDLLRNSFCEPLSPPDEYKKSSEHKTKSYATSLYVSKDPREPYWEVLLSEESMKLTFPLVTDKVYQGDKTVSRLVSSLHIEPVKKPLSP